MNTHNVTLSPRQKQRTNERTNKQANTHTRTNTHTNKHKPNNNPATPKSNPTASQQQRNNNPITTQHQQTTAPKRTNNNQHPTTANSHQPAIQLSIQPKHQPPTTNTNHNHHNHHSVHKCCLFFFRVTPAVGVLMDAERVTGGAERVRERQLCWWLRHERMTVAAELSAALHHNVSHLVERSLWFPRCWAGFCTLVQVPQVSQVPRSWTAALRAASDRFFDKIAAGCRRSRAAQSAFARSFSLAVER